MEILGGVATAVALVLSVWNFVTQVLRNGSASISARAEMYAPPLDDEQRRFFGSFERLVVTNYGPADATNVLVEGEAVLSGPVEVPKLHAGEEYHTHVRPRAWGEPDIFSVDLSWNDRRPGRRQRRTVWLSLQRII